MRRHVSHYFDGFACALFKMILYFCNKLHAVAGKELDCIVCSFVRSQQAVFLIVSTAVDRSCKYVVQSVYHFRR